MQHEILFALSGYPGEVLSLIQDENAPPQAPESAYHITVRPPVDTHPSERSVLEPLAAISTAAYRLIKFSQNTESGMVG